MDKAPMSMAPPAPESPAAAGHKFDGLTQDLKQDLKQDLARLIIAAMAERLGAAEARQREAQAWAAREQAARIAIETSTVWRMTAPLRALMSRVPGRLRHWRLSGHITAHTTPHRRQARVAAPIALPCAAAPEVSVVIPAHGEPDLVRACLAAIAAHPPLAAFEVILVDDASADPGIEALAGIEGLRFLRAPRNLGYLKACNWAAEAARGQFLMLLNSDTEVRAGWLDALLAALRETPDAAAAGARLIYPDGRMAAAGITATARIPTAPNSATGETPTGARRRRCWSEPRTGGTSAASTRSSSQPIARTPTSRSASAPAAAAPCMSPNRWSSITRAAPISPRSRRR
jgi:hypothetical protein